MLNKVYGKYKLPIFLHSILIGIVTLLIFIALYNEKFKKESLIVSIIIVLIHIATIIWLKNNIIVTSDLSFVYSQFGRKTYVLYKDIAKAHFARGDRLFPYHRVVRFIDKEGNVIIDIPSNMFFDVTNEIEFVKDILSRNDEDSPT